MQRPLATVIVGGMLLGPFLILLFVPVLRIVLMRRQHRPENSRPPSGQYPGYCLAPDNSRLLPEPTEQKAIAEAHRLRQSGRTLRAIAAELNRQGHRTRRGTPWRLEVRRPRPPPTAPSSVDLPIFARTRATCPTRALSPVRCRSRALA